MRRGPRDRPFFDRRAQAASIPSCLLDSGWHQLNPRNFVDVRERATPWSMEHDCIAWVCLKLDGSVTSLTPDPDLTVPGEHRPRNWHLEFIRPDTANPQSSSYFVLCTLVEHLFRIKKEKVQFFTWTPLERTALYAAPIFFPFQKINWQPSDQAKQQARAIKKKKKTASTPASTIRLNLPASWKRATRFQPVQQGTTPQQPRRRGRSPDGTPAACDAHTLATSSYHSTRAEKLALCYH